MKTCDQKLHTIGKTLQQINSMDPDHTIVPDPNGPWSIRFMKKVTAINSLSRDYLNDSLSSEDQSLVTEEDWSLVTEEDQSLVTEEDYISSQNRTLDVLWKTTKIYAR